jgi:hypothetical protein
VRLKKLTVAIVILVSSTACDSRYEESDILNEYKFRDNGYYTVQEWINGYQSRNSNKWDITPLNDSNMMKVCSGDHSFESSYTSRFDLETVPQYLALIEIVPGLDMSNGLGARVYIKGQTWKEFEDFRSSYYDADHDQKLQKLGNFASRINYLIIKECTSKAATNSSIKAALDTGLNVINEAKKNKEEAKKNIEIENANKKAEYNRFYPILVKLNEKARKYGGGSYKDFTDAQSYAGSLIRNGAESALTGRPENVRGVGCEATVSSSWYEGNPGGYWYCYIRLLGSSDYYAIEFDGQKWSGSPGSAGALVKWNTSDAFDKWFWANRESFS